MNRLQQFLDYAAAFEKTFVDDDWKRLEAFFTEDASYEVIGGGPIGGLAEGREAALGLLRKSVDTLDRRFDDRRVELVGAPEVEGDTVRFGWRAIYALANRSDLEIAGVETVGFEGDRIRTLVDDMEEGVAERVDAYLTEAFGALPSA